MNEDVFPIGILANFQPAMLVYWRVDFSVGHLFHTKPFQAVSFGADFTSERLQALEVRLASGQDGWILIGGNHSIGPTLLGIGKSKVDARFSNLVGNLEEFSPQKNCGLFELVSLYNDPCFQ